MNGIDFNQTMDPKRRELIHRFLNGCYDQRLLILAFQIDQHIRAEELFKYCITTNLTGKNVIEKIKVDHEGKWLLSTLADIVGMFENNRGRVLYADKDFGAA